MRFRRRRPLTPLLAASCCAVGLAGHTADSPGVPRGTPLQTDSPIVVASKPFAESLLFAEIFAQHLEARGFSVDRRPGLGSTEIAFGALKAGSIDVYPEYTGTGLLAILSRPPLRDALETFRVVDSEFRSRWGIRWLTPLGFENTYAIAMRLEQASELGVGNLSDLARVATSLTGGFSPDFIGREDGLPGLRAAYRLELADARSLLQSVKYEALAAGEVDVIDGYSTDGRLGSYGFAILEDDQSFFPPYEAAALVSEDLWSTRPSAIVALQELSGRFSEPMVRDWNRRIEVDGEPIPEVARDALIAVGLVDVSDTPTADRNASDGRTGFATYMWERREDVLRYSRRHLLLVAVSLLFAILIAVPLGLALERTRGAAETVIRAAGVLQTIPSIALLAFMIPLLGIGVRPALLALFLYSLYPILRNTFTGVRDADTSAVEAARALGMTPWQVLRYVRLPLAAPVIMAGIRTAAVINVGTATLAAFIGAGGLGDPIVAGLALSDTRQILLGAVPAALLALAVDLGLGWVERAAKPGGIA